MRRNQAWRPEVEENQPGLAFIVFWGIVLAGIISAAAALILAISPR